MATVAHSLDELVQAYLNDDAAQEQRRQVTQKRDQSIPYYTGVVTDFLHGRTTLAQFRDQLKTLHHEPFWGAKGAGFLMEINKLATYHSVGGMPVDGNLRTLLTGANVNNLGERIENCYQWLTQEKIRLAQLGKASNEIVSPKCSPLLLSLLVFWLDYPHVPYIYYQSLRQGIATLLAARLILSPSDIHSSDGGKTIDIFSNADHLAVIRTLEQIKNAEPALALYGYDIEQFLYWMKQKTVLVDEMLLIKEMSVTSPKAEPTEPVAGDASAEAQEEDEVTESQAAQSANPLRTAIENQPLAAIPETILKQRIQELRRSILVEESTVRRIYEALLLGHVILTGPPGTGKTELARTLPEILWRDTELTTSTNASAASAENNEMPVTQSAYTTTLVTATSEWSGRTLIGGIAPMVADTRISYHMEYGYLTTAILRNWDVNPLHHHRWEQARRARLTTMSALSQAGLQEFRGHWLVIDEFNRAPIDAALGEALTALSNGEELLLNVEGQPVKLPLPKDFRIIGTLNSFDRSYLNELSEALKRRFSFIEVLPPSRASRSTEQSIVLYKALKAIQQIPQFNGTIRTDESQTITWEDLMVEVDSYVYADNNAFIHVFALAWNLLEVIRIYRQLGTAQAITLIKRMLVQGIQRGYTTEEEWIEAFDTALSDTIADQLQVLLPDELDVLLWYLKLDTASFIERYNFMLSTLVSKPRRFTAHLEAPGSVLDENGQPFLSDEIIEQLLDMEEPQLPADLLTPIFHLDVARPALPQFTRRLRTFKVERGL